MSQDTFIIPKKLICYYSPFFEAAFNSPMVEGQTQLMKLDDVDFRIFEFFVHWLYTQDLCPNGEAFTKRDLTTLYRLADRFIVHPSKTTFDFASHTL
jgi:hypothetical protein